MTEGYFKKQTQTENAIDNIVEFPDFATADPNYIPQSLAMNQKLAFILNEARQEREVDPNNIDISSLPSVHVTTVIGTHVDQQIMRKSVLAVCRREENPLQFLA